MSFSSTSKALATPAPSSAPPAFSSSSSSSSASSSSSSASTFASPGLTAGAAAAAAEQAARQGVVDVFAGLSGTLRDAKGARPAARFSLDALLAAGFEPQAEATRLAGGGVGRVMPPTTAAHVAAAAAAQGWPLVSPSVELFGAVVGWRVEDRGGAGAAAALAAAAAAGSSASAAPLVPVLDRNVYEPYRFMFSALHERADALAERLEELGAAIVGNAAADELAAAAAASAAAAARALASGADGAPAVAPRPLAAMSVGRVCLDGETGRLNASSVALELRGGSGAGAGAGAGAGGGGGGGGGTRMTLDLREVASFGVFPGQVIGVRGAAPTGQRLIVSEIFSNGAAPRAQMPLANAKALHRARSAGGAGPVRVWCACGPYTSTGDLKYDPLTALLAELTAASPPPDVLVLQGPFVDAEHPMTRSGVAEVRDEAGKVANRLTFREVWAFVLANLGLFLQEEALARVEVVLMPSVQDVNAEAAFPQWPLQRSDFAPALDNGTLPDEVLRRITVLPNPASFVVGDLVFGATSADTVFHLTSEDATSRPAAGAVAVDRFSQLTRYMLEQRSFYPLYPAGCERPERAAPEERQPLPLEVSRLWHCGMNVRPDVLLAPTRIGRPCVRPVGVGRAGVDRDATVVVNPGFVAKGVRAGTFAKLAIFPGAAPGGGAAGGDEADAPEFVSAGAAERVLVEIVSLQVQ